MLEKELLWDSLDYGIFTSAYGWFNVFAFMLIIGGIILDKMGVRVYWYWEHWPFDGVGCG